MFPSVLCRQADLEVEGRVELKQRVGAERGKEFSGLGSIRVTAETGSEPKEGYTNR